MIILRTRAELRAWRTHQSPSARIGFVPTMGALHAGHLSLLQQAQASCDVSVVSIFVNPLQFGPNEDLARYPRPFERDCELLERQGCTVLFAPTPQDFYPADFSTHVIEEKVSQPLCGQFRPDHFQGVTTVVLKLLNLVQPHRAFFGQKDAQQCAVLERMVRDLDVPVELIRGETLREPDGLAMSSRNSYLSAEERLQALTISRALFSARALYQAGEIRPEKILAVARETLAQTPALQVQYCELRHFQTLEPLTELAAPHPSPDHPSERAVLAIAAWLGRTRLIDNCVL